MYEMHTRLRYTELDEYGKLSIGSLVDLLQDTSTFHSEDLQVGYQYLQEKGLVWMVSFWQIVIDRMPEFLEHIAVGTAAYEFTPAFGMRNFAVKDEAGKYLVKANSYWVMVNRNTGHAVRIPKEETEPYKIEKKLDMDYAPRKIAIPEEQIQLDALTVCRHHLDTNLHVNNGQYIKIALEQLPAKIDIGELRVEYRRQAILGDVIVPWISEEEDRYVVELSNEEKKPYAVAAFYKKR